MGGGYIFIHRMLLEYFAEFDTAKELGDPAMTRIDISNMLKRRDLGAYSPHSFRATWSAVLVGKTNYTLVQVMRRVLF